jgi:hypothetical protein
MGILAYSVPTVGSSRGLDPTIQQITRQRGLYSSTRLGQESPAIVLGPSKLGKLRIERLEAMGFKWSVVQRKVPGTASKKVAAAPFASSHCTEIVIWTVLTETQDSLDCSDPWREQATASLAAKPLQEY